jgi:hypothetical protein
VKKYQCWAVPGSVVIGRQVGRDDDGHENSLIAEASAGP